MAKRGSKLTRAEKILLSEEQKKAAGIDLSKPSHYAIKIASDNGVEDSRLGDQFRERPAQSGSSNGTIGQSSTLKARFTDTDVQKIMSSGSTRFSQRNAKNQIEEPDNKFFILDEKKILDPFRNLNSIPTQLTTLSYKGVAHFDTLNKVIQLPAPKIPINAQSATFFTARRHEQKVSGADRPDLFADTFLDRQSIEILTMVIQKWAISRTVISDPDDPESPQETKIVFNSDKMGPKELIKALQRWSNGCDNISPEPPTLVRKNPYATLVVSGSAWDHYVKRGGFATSWPKNEVQKENSPKAEAPEAVFNNLG